MRRRTMVAAAMAASVVRPAWSANGPSGGPAVLELFTSQGCLSCPPADALLGELSSQPDVIGLAWHVDYWNRLGWPAPYASSARTDRQRQYARILRDEVYTPALVVNGSSMVVGSDRRAVGRAMQAGRSALVAVSLRREGTQVQADFGAMPAGATALLAIYDSEQMTPVRAGENAGRRLREFRIVREVRPVTVTDPRVFLPAPGPGQGIALLVQDAA